VVKKLDSVKVFLTLIDLLTFFPYFLTISASDFQLCTEATKPSFVLRSSWTPYEGIVYQNLRFQRLLGFQSRRFWFKCSRWSEKGAFHKSAMTAAFDKAFTSNSFEK